MAGSVVTGDLGFFPRAHVGKLTACYSSSSWGFGGLFWPLRAPAFMCHTQAHTQAGIGINLWKTSTDADRLPDYLYHTVEIAHLILFVAGKELS